MKASTQRVVIFALSLGVVGYGLLRTIPLFINTDDIKLQIEKGLHQSTGVNFKIKELTLEPTLFSGLQAHLNTTTITDMQRHPLGDVENISVQIRYLPLLTRQTPEIAKVHLNHVHIPVGEYSLFKAVKLKLVKPPKTGFLNPAELKDAEILLTDYLLEDYEPADSTLQVFPKVQRFRLEGKTVSVRHLESQKPVSVLGSGELVYLTLPNSGHSTLNRDSQGQFKLFLEIPQAALAEGHTFTPEELGRLELSVDGKAVHFDLKYQHKQNQTAEGSLQSPSLDVMPAQALAFQLADTIGLPIPSDYSPYWAAGKTQLDTRFKLNFVDGKPVFQEANGQIGLNNMALFSAQDFKTPLVNRIHGNILLNGKQIDVRQMQLVAEGLPANIKGTYDLDTQRIDAVVYAHNMRVKSLQNTANRLGVSPQALAGRNINGLLNIDTRITGTATMPAYQGLIAIQNGAFSDPVQGIEADHVNGKITFKGKGIQAPQVEYQGRLQINNGKLIVASQGLNVNRFDGNVQFKGAVQPHQKTIAMPNLTGTVYVREASYTEPTRHIPVTGIQGVLKLVGDQINIENFRGLLSGSEYRVTGRIATNLKDYQIRLQGNNIDLPRLKREIVDKLPEAQGLSASLEPYSGRANLNLTASTGMNLAGTLDVNTLALRTAQADSSIQIPHMALRFNGQRISLADSKVLYGPLAATIGGDFTTQGSYHVRLNSGTVPVSFVRDNQDLLAAFAGSELPEIWNTAGDFTALGTLSNQKTNLAVTFHNAGLSWKGGDFPLYGVNGTLNYQQTGKAAPHLNTESLTMRYGNSPIQLTVNHQSKLSGEVTGELSALTVNHFLVSPQSDASPYQPVPFRTRFEGELPALPGEPKSGKNNLTAHLLMDLERNFRDAYNTPNGQPLEKTQEQKVATEAQSAQQFEKQIVDENKQAPDILQQKNSPKKVLKNINAINAANTTVGLFRQTIGQTIGRGIDTLKKPGEFISQKILNPPHESMATQSPAPTSIPGNMTQEELTQDQGKAYLYARLHLLGNNLLMEKANLHLFDAGNIVADGQLQNLHQPDQMQFTAHMVTVPELNLAAIAQGAVRNNFFKDAKGTIGADIQAQGTPTSISNLTGWLATNRLEVPYLTLQDVTGRVNLQGLSATAEVPSFRIPGVTARASASTENITETPVSLENVKIDGSFISVASLADFNNNIVKPILVDQVVHNYLKPWQQGDPTSPVQFRNADLHVNELIYQNIILSNVNSKFSLNPNSFFELTNTSLEAAGGKVDGYLSMSPNENAFTTLELNAKGVKANALTKALLNVTNEIFGDLDGTVRFTTFGQSDVAMQKNANGTVTMKITNGRLPAIAKVETLLATANVLRGGVLGLNLNNLFRSLTIYDSNYFAELSGDMLINDQILYTQNLVSDGVNLDLLIQGSLRMDNGNANMLVNGRMSQVVAGKLGTVGNFSLGQLLHYIPGLGNFGKNQPGLLGYLPGIGYVPGFGGPAGKYNRFQVRLLGQPDDPAAIQDFQWVKPQNL